MRTRARILWSGGVVAVGTAVVLLTGSLGHGQGREGIVPVPDPGAFAIRVDRGEGARYRPGDRVSFELQVPEAGSLTVYDVTPRGRVQVVFPHAWTRGCRVGVGRLSLPGAGDRWHYEIGSAPGGRGGVECVIAVLASRGYPPPRWLPTARLGETAERARPADVLRKRLAEAEGLNRRIVWGVAPAPPDGCWPRYRVAHTWFRVRPPR